MDVQGYSRLMGDDEIATVKTITEYRKTVESLVTDWKGRVVDSPGDNILAEFTSVVDAVQCAVEIQNVLKVKNQDLPENRKMIFRIGINLGDVIQEGNRIYGDGVNIAARLESLADGGGICISGTAYDHIENKLALGYDYFGEHSVKNISKPVRVYKVPLEPGQKNVTKKGIKKWQLGALAALLVLLVAGVALWSSYPRSAKSPDENNEKKIPTDAVEKAKPPLAEKPSIAILPFTNIDADPKISAKLSIAVLPFDNISGDSKEQYLCDGFTEHIITVLAKIPDLSVTARNTTFTYKGKAVNIQQIGKDLNVHYVLEGSIQKSGNKIRLTAQLIDTATGNHLWAETYDRNIEDIFELQDEIALEIAKNLNAKILMGTSIGPCARTTSNVSAYLKFLEAMHNSLQGDPAGNQLAMQKCKEALVLDPDYGPAYAYLALCYLNELTFCTGTSPKESITNAFKMAKKAMEAKNICPFAHAAMAWVYMYMGQMEKALEEFNIAKNIDPNWPDYYAMFAFYLCATGQPHEALASIEKAFRLNPLPPAWYFTNIGFAYFLSGKYDEAISAYKEAISLESNFLLAHRALVFLYILLGREEDARHEISEVLRIDPKYSLACAMATAKTLYKGEAKEIIIKGLKKTQLK